MCVAFPVTPACSCRSLVARTPSHRITETLALFQEARGGGRSEGNATVGHDPQCDSWLSVCTPCLRMFPQSLWPRLCHCP